MIRTVIITLLNLVLPFLLYFLYLNAKQYWAKKYQKHTGEPQHKYPWKMFLIFAFTATLVFIFVERLFLFESDASFEHHIPKSDHIYK